MGAGAALRAAAFHPPVRAGGARRAAAFPLPMGAGAALRAAAFHPPVRAGGTHRAPAFQLPVRAGVALRAVSFQRAVGAGAAVHAAAFQLPVRAGAALHALVFRLAVGARVTVHALVFLPSVRAPLHCHNSRPIVACRAPRVCRPREEGSVALRYFFSFVPIQFHRLLRNEVSLGTKHVFPGEPSSWPRHNHARATPGEALAHFTTLFGSFSFPRQHPSTPAPRTHEPRWAHARTPKEPFLPRERGPPKKRSPPRFPTSPSRPPSRRFPSWSPSPPR